MTDATDVNDDSASASALSDGLPGNADQPLTPRESPGRGSVAFDLPGVHVGTAEYAEGPTGCTVVHIPAGARTAVDSRGGAVGLSGGYSVNHAICLAGGSVYGLAAAAGVSDELLRQRGNHTGWEDLRLVSGAVIFDYTLRSTAIHPDAELGRAALRAAGEGVFPVGRCGAGRSASAGKVDRSRAEPTGQGAAFGTFGTAKVLFATVVNSIGVIVDRDGTILRGNLHADDVRRHPHEDYAALAGAPAVMGNTTLSVLVTNVKLTDQQLDQFGRQVHSSMHRGIQPFHTEQDGDVLFTLTTDDVELAGVTPAGLGTLASELAWDAIVSAGRD